HLPESLHFDLIVSPANSYGRLDGSFDDAISRAFCLQQGHGYDTLTRQAQGVLYEKFRGFAPPRSCTLVPFPEELLYPATIPGDDDDDGDGDGDGDGEDGDEGGDGNGDDIKAR
ncbi:hypothetical protein BJX70DRAFT_401526, partial [Aspergillus crustosus]